MKRKNLSPMLRIIQNSDIDALKENIHNSWAEILVSKRFLKKNAESSWLSKKKWGRISESEAVISRRSFGCDFFHALRFFVVDTAAKPPLGFISNCQNFGSAVF